MKVCIDPGHGGRDPGCIGTGGVYEKTVNLAVCLKAKELFERLGYKVRLTRETDVALSKSLIDDLQARCDKANAWGADLFVSVHCNAPGRSADIDYAQGISIYALAHPRPAACALWYMAGFTRAKNRGVHTDRRFYVLRKTAMPAILVELGFLTHPGEGVLLQTESYQDRLIDGLAAGIDLWRREQGLSL